ncbi:MAG: hypothetical protein ACKV22_25695 [Bryobacteraceae bacterium]
MDHVQPARHREWLSCSRVAGIDRMDRFKVRLFEEPVEFRRMPIERHRKTDRIRPCQHLGLEGIDPVDAGAMQSLCALERP